MKIRSKRLLLIIVPLLIIVMACGGLSTPSAPPVDNVSTIVAATIQALTTAAPNTPQTDPTQVSPTAPPPPSGIQVSFQNISFVIPQGLASGAASEIVPEMTDQNGAPWDVAPQHIRFTLDGYNSPLGKFSAMEMSVFPAQEYAAVYQGAAESLKRLQAVLASPNAQYTNDALPYVPYFNAGQVIAAQQRIIQFAGGSGIRIVTQYAQDVSPINNGGLFYHFEGLTSDGKYYVVAVLPIGAPFLAASNDPAAPLPPGGIPFPDMTSTDGTVFQNYYQTVTDALNKTASDTFQPSLDTLDALVQSITITP